MKRYLSLIIIFISAALALSAEEADYKLEVQNFTELKVTDAINVVYHCSQDSAGWAYFRCDPSISSKLLFSNNKSCLHIQVASDGEIIVNLPTIHVYSNVLAKVENAADSTVTVLGNVMVPKFSAKLMGNGAIIVKYVETGQLSASITTGNGHIVLNSGTATTESLSSVSTGTIEAGGIKAKKVKVKLFGTGDIDCTAEETLTIYGAGSGSVYYKGEPQISNRSLGIKALKVN